MSDEKVIRLDNLKRLVKTPKELQDRMSTGRYSYWRDLFVGKKSFGEKTARHIEGQFGLPRFWLDRDGAPLPAEAPAPDDLAHGLAQLLRDIAETPEALRGQATLAAINAVARVKFGTDGEPPEPEPDAPPPKPARQRAARKAPTAGRASTPKRTAK